MAASIAPKAKTAALSLSKKKTSASSLGAPAQHNQSSRKGKKAWRKNVDIEAVEGRLEEIRGEERTFGTALHAKKDEDLFIVDKKGDEKVRASLKKFSRTALSSHRILSERSAIPAVFSRPSTTASKRKSGPRLTHAEKDRLLRTGKRSRKGPLNSIVDHEQFGEGSALLDISEAVKQSGQYDVWVEDVEGTKVKAPKTPNPRANITLPAIPAPHAGTSYNPPASEHEALLRNAHDVEAVRAKQAAEAEAFKARIINARREIDENEEANGVPGMLVIKPEDHPEDEAGEPQDGEAVVRKMPERKTKQQRRKAEKQRAEKRVLAEKVYRRRLLASVDSAKRLRVAAEASQATRAQVQAVQQAKLAERLQNGLMGQRLGKHKVQEGALDVQLGEELSESLRGLKPEGNLFRDRFISMQHRALVEPRVPVLPTKRKNKFKEVEKHAWKRFDQVPERF